MKITEKDVRYVAELAHLDLSPEEQAQFLSQLDSILEYVGQLNELDTSKVEPMAQVLAPQPENVTLRDDVVRPSFPADLALSNAPEQGAGQFKVPKVIERE
jgi:aspartyl-tRNA(Asn)/glutamyl-tRNA(Gln) amidotransferase subunit C